CVTIFLILVSKMVTCMCFAQMLFTVSSPPQAMDTTSKETVSWSATSDDLLQFRWREHDGPILAPPVREGLGRKLIKSSLPVAGRERWTNQRRGSALLMVENLFALLPVPKRRRRG